MNSCVPLVQNDDDDDAHGQHGPHDPRDLRDQHGLHDRDAHADHLLDDLDRCDDAPLHGDPHDDHGYEETDPRD
jgi:hypothetical protein